MIKTAEVQHYPPAEEAVNIWSHAIGLVLSVVALLALVERAIKLDSALTVFSFSVFGLSLVFLYCISTVYHSSKSPARRIRLRIVDHASIFILIAGTYTPFTLITLKGTTGWVIFGISWSMALTGIVLKLFFTGRYRLLSTALYLLMGWIIIFAIIPLIQKLPSAGLTWLVAGGLAYTLGAVIYAIKKIHFNHAIFHLFVLLGSVCHFMAVYFYVT